MKKGKDKESLLEDAIKKNVWKNTKKRKNAKGGKIWKGLRKKKEEEGNPLRTMKNFEKKAGPYVGQLFNRKKGGKERPKGPKKGDRRGRYLGKGGKKNRVK